MQRRIRDQVGRVPSRSMVSLLPDRWMTAPGDHGVVLVFGYDTGCPEVVIRVEQALCGVRDLGESVAELLASSLMRLTGGSVLTSLWCRGLSSPAAWPAGVSPPSSWTILADDPSWLVLGGDDARNPDVVIRIEQTVSVARGRDLTESLAWLVGEVLARATGGRTTSADLCDDHRAWLSARLRQLWKAEERS